MGTAAVCEPYVERVGQSIIWVLHMATSHSQYSYIYIYYMYTFNVIWPHLIHSIHIYIYIYYMYTFNVICVCFQELARR